MTERISLVEAYDNRDVIAQLVRLRDNVDELLNILKDIDPNGDLTNVVTKTGDQTIDGVKTFIGKIVADCDIIQNGSAYETHAEQVYSTKDYIVLRDGALGGLSPGDFSGLRVNKYDSVNDGHLVVDRDGIARVGDVGDEQPLMTRDETGDMTSGNFVLWDGVNGKAITSSLAPTGVITGSGNIGGDDQPVKIVDGSPVAVSSPLALAGWTDVTNDMTKIATANEILLMVRESSTFWHSMIYPMAAPNGFYCGLSASTNYYNARVHTGGITVLSSAGTWDQAKVFVR